METWKAIAGYEGLYEVSSLGRVRSLDTFVNARFGKRFRKGRILRQSPDRAGYMQTHLSKDNAVATVKVHRVVATNFISSPPHSLAVVNHIDFKKSHNSVENLEWCTSAENVNHAARAGRMDASFCAGRAKKLTVEKALAIRAAHANGMASNAIGKVFGISGRTARRVIARKIWARV